MKIEEYKGKKCPYNNKVEIFSVACKMCSTNGKCNGPENKMSIEMTANLLSIIESVFDINKYTNRYATVSVGPRDIDVHICMSISKAGVTNSWHFDVDNQKELKKCCAELSIARDNLIEEMINKDNTSFDELLVDIQQEIYMIAIDNPYILKTDGAELFLRGKKELNGDQIAEILCALKEKRVIK